MKKPVEVGMMVAGGLFAVLILYALMLAYSRRHLRMAAIKDCSTAQTQTVSVAFAPAHVRWRMSGQIEGRGTAIIPGAFSNLVSGRVHTQGSGDFYQTNASLIFLPDGAARGWLEASFRFADGP